MIIRRRKKIFEYERKVLLFRQRNYDVYCDRKMERDKQGSARGTGAGFRKVEHSFDDNERICNHDYIVQDPAVS